MSDPVGCRGRTVEPYDRCLRHLSEREQDVYFGGLTPGADVDHRATRFSGVLLARLLNAVRPNPNGPSTLGRARFNSAVFEEWEFEKVVFEERADFSEGCFESSGLFINVEFRNQANFDIAKFRDSVKFADLEFARLYMSGATFEDSATFDSVSFKKAAYFDSVTFARHVDFIDSSFEGASSWRGVRFEECTTFQHVNTFSRASFNRAFFQSLHVSESVFSGVFDISGAVIRETDMTSTEFVQSMNCDRVKFTGPASFDSCIFSGPATFTDTWFHRSVSFSGSTFEASQTLGPLWCSEDVLLDGARFLEPTAISVVAQRLSCFRTRWDGSSSLTLAHAEVNLAAAVIMQPFSVNTHVASLTDQEFQAATDTVWERDDVGLRSLIGVDCSMLTLHDVDLSSCHFLRAIHLDQLRLEGRNTFRTTPQGRIWVHGFPFKWTRRQIIADEHHWRFNPAHPPRRRRGWSPPEYTLSGLDMNGASLAIAYRQLRKGREDAKDEPGAADFYYGEMEMRRHERKWSEVERWLLQAYWLLSGYGLRASRALGWLALAMMTTLLLMMGFGLPQEPPKQVASGILSPGGGKVTFEIDKGDPRNPTSDRFTSERFEKALSTTLNSVVFRSSGQDLTTAGGYIEMASRFSEPVLLGLAVLAIRGRVKR
ncbi:pentapeptide repeat-containing protein [Streptomyces sp. NPDC000931]|uniref:pentapeptide repeat-containing protein n=1 Tax=Streptomyces sp. NPDC000931 TaxID=3154372 RepID=UPI0033244DE8